MAKRRQDGPDRGWSWVIASAACFNSLVLAGIIRACGVLFVEFIKEFGVTREEASWPVVLCVSVFNLTGLLTGALGHRFGVRRVTMVGSLIATAGISCCYLTTSLTVITVLFGVVFGVGYGLIATLMPVIVNEYFLNYRAMANGIANAGSCFGSILLPPLFEFLIDRYGLSGCFLLTGGIVFHTAISGALMRPPMWLQSEEPSADDSCKSNANHDQSFVRVGSYRTSEYDDSCKSNANDQSFIRVDSYRSSEYDAVVKSIERRNSEVKSSARNKVSFSVNQSPDIEEYEACSFNNEEGSRKMQSGVLDAHNLENITNYISDTKADSIKDVTSSMEKYSSKEPNEKDKIEDDICRSIKSLRDSLNILQDVFEKAGQQSAVEGSCNSINEVNRIKLATKNETGNRGNNKEPTKVNHRSNYSIQNYENKGFINVIKENNSNLHQTCDLFKSSQQIQSTNSNALDLTDENSFTNKITNSGKEADEHYGGYQSNENSKLPQGIIGSFKQVLTCPMFYITSITNVTFYTLFFTFVVIIVDFLLDNGVPDKDTKYVLFAFGTSDLIGRLCLGWITDRKFLRRSHFVMGCMLLIGLIFFSFPLAPSYIWFIIISCFYGLLQGCTMVLFPILLVDYLGLERHAIAMGCLCFLNGIASLIRPFLIGYFRDNMGSYSDIFYLLGGVGLASSFLWLLERFIVGRDRTNV